MPVNSTKIALIGGMNNNLFSLLRYLTDAGYDCKLFLFSNEHSHFLPENDTWEIDQYKEKISTLDFGNGLALKNFWYAFTGQKFANLNEFDLVFGCGYAPMYSSLFKFKLDIFFPYGSDLIYGTTYRKILSSPNPKQILKNIVFNFSVLLQRNGIKKCSACWSFAEPPAYRSLSILREVIRYKFPTPMVYPAEVKKSPSKDDELSKFLDLNKVKKSGYVLASQTRHLWRTPIIGMGEPDFKYNQRLIGAFANFLKSTEKPINAILVFFEYGPDVIYSKELIKKLNIEEHVVWSKIMPRRLLLYFFQHYVSLGADQFGAGCLSGTSQEILASGKPVMTYLDKKQYENNEYKEATFSANSGIINCENEKDILEGLSKHYNNESDHERIGKCAKRFFDTFLGVGGASLVCLEIERLMKEGKRD